MSEGLLARPFKFSHVTSEPYVCSYFYNCIKSTVYCSLAVFQHTDTDMDIAGAPTCVPELPHAHPVLLMMLSQKPYKHNKGGSFRVATCNTQTMHMTMPPMLSHAHMATPYKIIQVCFASPWTKEETESLPFWA